MIDSVRDTWFGFGTNEGFAIGLRGLSSESVVRTQKGQSFEEVLYDCLWQSFQNKGFWMAKGSGHLTDGDAAYDNSSRVEPKRSYKWFADATEPELFPNKKQAVQAPNSKLTTGILNANPSPWENDSSLPSAPSQFMERLFGGDTNRPFKFTEQNISSVGTEKGINVEFGNDSSMGLSMSHNLDDPETCLSYGGIRKVRVNQVKDCDNGLDSPKGHNSGTSIVQAYNHNNETSFISMGQGYGKEDEGIILMGRNYKKDTIISIGSASETGNDNSMSIGHTYNKGEANTASFDGFHEDHVFDPMAGPLSSYPLIYDQPSIQTSETPNEKEFDGSTASAVVNVSRVTKSRTESVPKNKSELKATRKEAPNSFPSNVRSLISTGMLDGVPVKYVSLSREKEHRGTIKGCGYLCGCQSCNYSKVLNAYEFEQHAGCKTKHPNNHIYFESGKTIYQIVQELRNTPESQLFDAIQTVTGSPINQKSFRTWKESFQAATRELQRIYGKEELNL
ncbi:hypothetical protein HYC85_008817 [Camellia sinensis]|uniref:Tify domain-containing protein n=1 Tax=Camellia sinensis TaxID=4442 RepID=A0A7J7HUN3_CAMSI|nr:hypothetical protein HYC85_008817 [Camellia sinensis]